MKKTQISEFGKRLKESFQNIQNKEIAKIIGVSEPAISAYMTGNFPNIEKLIEISKITGYSIDWLLTGEEENTPKPIDSDFTSLIICGYKGAVGTSLSACYIALSLATSGKKVLIIDNKARTQTVYFASNLFSRKGRNEEELLTNENVYFQTDFPNIEIFLGKGFSYWSGLKKRLKPFKKPIFQMKNDYDFVICDAPSYENPFRSSDLIFNAILDKSKVIIPYDPTRSNPDDLGKILKFIDAESDLGFHTELLGLFISYERKNKRKDDLYLNKIEQISSIIQEKMFNKVIKDVTQFGETGELDHRKDLEEIQQTRLFKEYSKLTKEILSRIDK